jgi:hypothetical protein
MNRFALALLALSLMACAIPEEDFPDAYAKAACDRQEECNADGYANRWDSDVECEESWADLAELLLDVGDLFGETYDPAKGRECVRDLKTLSCDELEDGDHECDVWEDEDA